MLSLSPEECENMTLAVPISDLFIFICLNFKKFNVSGIAVGLYNES